MEKWRNIFGDLAIHGAISELTLENVKTAIHTCFHEGTINQEEILRLSGIIGDLNKYDFSITWKQVSLECRPAWDSPPLRLPLLLRETALKATAKNKFELTAFSHRFFEFRNLIQQLITYRNKWSHSEQIDETGWNFLLGSLLLRLIEICDADDFQSEKVDLIRQSAFELIAHSILEEPYGTVAKMLSSQLTPTETENNSEQSSMEDRLLQEIKTINLKIDQALRPMPFSPSSELLEEAQIEDEDLGIDDQVFTSNSLTSELAKQQLLKIRNQIEHENEFNVDWPGPGANIMQLSIIEDMMKFKPNDLEAWRSMPQVEWHYRENQVVMDNQLETWWPKINAIIERVNWKT
jgi:hypothetical protein